jgi:hypothetical protein
MKHIGHVLLVIALCITSFFLGESCCQQRWKIKIVPILEKIEKIELRIMEFKQRHEKSRKKP